MASPAPDTVTWGARFGWLVGGLAGIVFGLMLTYGLEVWLFRGHARNATESASHAASVVVPLAFIAGALGGHAFGARGGVRRYRALGVAAGVLIAAFGWALLVLTR